MTFLSFLFLSRQLLKAGQFDRVMRISKSLKYPTGYEPETIIQVMVERGNISTALKHIMELKDRVVGGGGDGGVIGGGGGGGGGESEESGESEEKGGVLLLSLFNVEKLIESLFLVAEYDNVLKYAR